MSIEAMCLSVALWFEARGESKKGQEAVAQTIINRSKHPSYPNSICGVIKQKGQFSFYNKNVSLSKPPKLSYKDAQHKEQWQQIRKVAYASISCTTQNHVGNALYFNTTKLGVRFKTNVKPRRIDDHVFY